ncbi:hypothetical protein DPMN_069875 [Dreissena polymorpha]|uniref:Uncharacterized protein n=1 Tax=Dreissena polymorpha TaxID=45954 RepID=A0A9D3Z508_DREPO|nr:hypothetical protein DPMN_069875 [Dreissena polymorpha]
MVRSLHCLSGKLSSVVGLFSVKFVLSVKSIKQLKKAFANIVDPDETPHDAASHQVADTVGKAKQKRDTAGPNLNTQKNIERVEGTSPVADR